MVLADRPANEDKDVLAGSRGSRTIRVSADSYRRLSDEAGARNASVSEALDQMLAELDHLRFIEESRASCARLRSDPGAWADYLEELAEIEDAFSDATDAG